MDDRNDAYGAILRIRERLNPDSSKRSYSVFETPITLENKLRSADDAVERVFERHSALHFSVVPFVQEEGRHGEVSPVNLVGVIYLSGLRRGYAEIGVSKRFPQEALDIIREEFQKHNLFFEDCKKYE